MNFKFALDDKIGMVDLVDYFCFRDYPIIMDKLDSDKKWIHSKTYESFISLYNKDLNFSNLPSIKDNYISEIYNLIQEINFVKVIKYIPIAAIFISNRENFFIVLRD